MDKNIHKTEMPENVLSQTPIIHPSVFIADGAKVMGDVHIGKNASIWYNAVLRGDINAIHIGERSNVQDGSIIHVENDRQCYVGNDVTVGHKAILHGCTIEDGCLIGMGAIILNGAILKKGCVVGAGAIVTENTIVGSNERWVGIPARCIKSDMKEQYVTNIKWAKKYTELAIIHARKAELL